MAVSWLRRSCGGEAESEAEGALRLLRSLFSLSAVRVKNCSKGSDGRAYVLI
ncbi:MAG: hypothetical protein ACI835_001825 [Planctomycetota bacterium]|jgi:hypothetical protein